MLTGPYQVASKVVVRFNVRTNQLFATNTAIIRIGQ